MRRKQSRVLEKNPLRAKNTLLSVECSNRFYTPPIHQIIRRNVLKIEHENRKQNPENFLKTLNLGYFMELFEHSTLFDEKFWFFLNEILFLENWPHNFSAKNRIRTSKMFHVFDVFSWFFCVIYHKNR